MKNSGSKESGSNCERNKSTGQARKKGKGTQRQTKRRPKGQKTAENEKEKPKGKKIKSSSTTISTDTNKSSDKNHSKGSPDKDYNDETSNVSTNAKSSDLSKEDTRSPNLITCQEMKPKSKPKSRRISIEEEDEAKEKKEKEKRTERTVDQTAAEKTEKEKRTEITIDQTAAEKTEKEKEEVTEKEEKKFNMHLAQLFFKRMMDAQRTRKTGNQKRDQNLEVMPDRGWISKPIKVARKGPRLPRKPRPLDTTIFKPSGEPVWVEFELQEEVLSTNGVKTKTPQLQEALEDSDLELDDGKQWVPMFEEYSNGRFDDGKFQFSPDELNPFGTFKELEKRSERFSRPVSIKYYTMKNLIFMSKSAIERSSRLLGPLDQTPIEELRRKEADSHFQKPSKEEEEEKEKEKTCVVTSISFNTESTFSISYDRRRPILSIQKFRKKYQERLRRSIDKKESREGTSKEGASREGKSRENT
ncbi:hypothetical protein CRE_28632 [Caenorhabditis remanei]|uniref:Uncharacterized protein n=1 Tax=Caenorhabditis remanei TaxID=31234 RepID=E3LNC5_CAERE|nr:hypothetical protein CRE_28632 [Caenorhabditis remanei]